MFRLGLSKMILSFKSNKTGKTIKYVSGGLMVMGITYSIANTKDREIRSMMGSTLRFFRSVKIGLTISFDYWISTILGESINEIHQRAANRLLNGCLQNGGIYIKLGQGLAAVNHILPKEYSDTLSTLQDKCLTRNTNELEVMFQEDFGKKPEQIFRKIEPEPVAAASLAQVYKGETINGEPVAIKVQYIDLRDRFESDIKTIKYLLKLISVMHPKFDLHWVIDELHDTLIQELDFESEGKNGERCAQDLNKHSYVHVPKIHWNLSTKRILTTEWIDGIKISNIDDLKKNGFNTKDVHRKFITLMAEQIFHTGFVHADPHPGNVLVRKGKDNTAQIVLLDHGLYEYIPEATRVTLCNYWEAMVLKNEKAMQKFAKELNVDDHKIFAEMVTQAPFKLSLFKINPSRLVEEEYMIQQAQERFDKITATLKSMPKCMMLVIRNLNTVRAITYGYEDPIQRYKLMAKIAVRGRYQIRKRSFSKMLPVALNKMQFEIQLWIHGVMQNILKLYFYILQMMGYNIQEVLETIAI